MEFLLLLANVNGYGFREATHFQLWTYIIATPLGGFSLFAGYLLLSWAWQKDQGRSLWLMVAGFALIIGLRLYNGDFTYGFVGAIVMLIRIAPEVKHLDEGRWGRNLMIVGVVSYFVGLLNYPLGLPRDVTATELSALEAVMSMGRREGRGDDLPERAAGAPPSVDAPEPATTPAFTRVASMPPPPPTRATSAPATAAIAVPPTVAAPSTLVIAGMPDVLREGLALKAREQKLRERKAKLNEKDIEAVRWLSEDIARYNADQQAFHAQAVRIDPNYAAALAPLPTPTPTPIRKRK